MDDFQERLEEGYVEEVELIQHILENAATDEDLAFMAKHRFDISMILNGRVREDKVSTRDLRDMVNNWNKRIGFKVIFAEYL